MGTGTYKIVVCTDDDGKWIYKAVSGNGRVLVRSSQFGSKTQAVSAANNLLKFEEVQVLGKDEDHEEEVVSEEPQEITDPIPGGATLQTLLPPLNHVLALIDQIKDKNINVTYVKNVTKACINRINSAEG